MSIRRGRLSQPLIAFWVVVAFAVRALLPHGFMPGTEPFTLKLCPAGLPTRGLTQAVDVDPHAAHHAHHAHGHHIVQPSGVQVDDDDHSHDQGANQCPFGVAATALALAHAMDSAVPWMGAGGDAIPLATSVSDLRPAHRPQPRGPPAFS